MVYASAFLGEIWKGCVEAVARCRRFQRCLQLGFVVAGRHDGQEGGLAAAQGGVGDDLGHGAPRLSRRRRLVNGGHTHDDGFGTVDEDVGAAAEDIVEVINPSAP